MSVKRGTPLPVIGQIDASLLRFLRTAHGITTLEELVEAVSFSPNELEQEALEYTKNANAFQYVYRRACEILGPNVVYQLQQVRQKHATGALNPNQKTVLLEVPQNTNQKFLEEFLQTYQYKIEGNLVLVPKGKIIYRIEGPQAAYNNLQRAVKKEKKYRLYSNPKGLFFV